MSTSAILCAECQNPWPQGAAVCPVCGSRVSHVGATGTQTPRAIVATPAPPTTRRPRVAISANANGAASNGAASNGATVGGAPSLPSAPEVASALEAGVGLRGQTFVIERVLRRGGFCISYAARVAGLEQSAIVQELVPPGCVRQNREIVAARMAQAEFERLKTRYEAEARALTSFSHPGIVAARLAFEENNTLYLAMERAPGQTLQERVEESGPLAPNQAVEVITQIGAMIVALHEAGLAHGDIRPLNISLSRAVTIEQTPRASTAEYALRAMLNDWGLERWLEESYVVTGGAEAAASPESDVAGLAATLFFALTGQRPPTSRQDAAQLLNISDSPEGSEQSGSPINRSLAEAVLRGLERDTQPPLTARAFLESIQQTTAPPAPPKSTPARVANRTPFDALLTGQKKTAPRAADSSIAAPVAAGGDAKNQARPPAATGGRAANRWVQDVALSVGGAILVGLAAWLLTTQNPNHAAPPQTPAGTSATPQMDTRSDANTANSVVVPAETPATLSATPPAQQTPPESQLNAPLPTAKAQEVAPQTAAVPTPPTTDRRVPRRAAALVPSVANPRVKSPNVSKSRPSLFAARRLRRAAVPAVIRDEPVAPHKRLRSSRRLAAQSVQQVERPQLQMSAPELQLPPEAPIAPRFRAPVVPRLRTRVAPRFRRRMANRALRRGMHHSKEPGLPPSAPSSAPAEAGLPPTP